jgi:hypothetical protein
LYLSSIIHRKDAEAAEIHIFLLSAERAESKMNQPASDFQIQCELQREKGNMAQLEFQFNSNESAKPTKFSEDYGHKQYNG